MDGQTGFSASGSTGVGALKIALISTRSRVEMKLNDITAEALLHPGRADFSLVEVSKLAS